MTKRRLIDDDVERFGRHVANWRAEYVRDEVVPQLVAEISATRAAWPVCAQCKKQPAACVGSYEGDGAAFACDECCGHSNEDGWCCPIAEVDKALNRYADNMQRLDDRLAESRQLLAGRVQASPLTDDEREAVEHARAIVAQSIVAVRANYGADVTINPLTEHALAVLSKLLAPSAGAPKGGGNRG